jgi:hypothetical protein
MIKDQPKFDPVTAFIDTAVTNLSWGHLINILPSVRKEVAHAMAQERGKRPHKRNGLTTNATNLLHEFEVDNINGASGLAISEDLSALIVNFCTQGRVSQTRSYSPLCNIRVFNITKILMDGGSVLSLMPLWLGRRWLKQVQAIGDFKTDIYYMHDTIGNKYAVTAEKTQIREQTLEVCLESKQSPTISFDQDEIDEIDVGLDGYINKMVAVVETQADEQTFRRNTR